MALEQRCPVVLLCCGAFSPITHGHTEMFEIARNFLERTGNHIVISGVISPSHDSHPMSTVVSSTDRIAMCNMAVKKHLWLSVDTWESSQSGWVKIIKVLHQVSNRIKSDYGVEDSKVNNINFKHSKYAHSAVTLQPNGSLQHQVLQNGTTAVRSSSIMPCTMINSVKQDDGLELNEASEAEEGIAFNRLSNNFHKMCCAPPAVAFNLQDNLIYGAAYDLRRTKVMLLCGGDFLESFGLPGLWTDEEISEIVSEYGIVCIPRVVVSDNGNKGQYMRNALDRLQKIFCHVQGTVIIVNDARRAAIAHISSTKCRNAIKEKRLDEVEGMLDPSVLNYIIKRGLYVSKQDGKR
uniref:Nicotinamide mononucleotide adenylyltransferase 1 n=1 Tax=Phallusia mammillata TaxID=59560 RepID=A0A6F9DLQ8_9ASCI|nr:nicotinamide mononucleotide adenylyltransferase 1 [Phallusia mammillata]